VHKHKQGKFHCPCLHDMVLKHRDTFSQLSTGPLYVLPLGMERKRNAFPYKCFMNVDHTKRFEHINCTVKQMYMKENT
jgi:hypothetical protein